MMRKLFIFTTLLFWLIVLGFWLANIWLPKPQESKSSALTANERYTLVEVARHNQRNNCWMVIGGSVYDFSTYLPEHPADLAVMLRWCGMEATWAFETKAKGRSHSRYATQLLAKYHIGQLDES